MAQDRFQSSSYRWCENGHKEIRSHHVKQVTKEKRESESASILSMRFAKEPTIGNPKFEATNRFSPTREDAALQSMDSRRTRLADSQGILRWSDRRPSTVGHYLRECFNVLPM